MGERCSIEVEVAEGGSCDDGLCWLAVPARWHRTPHLALQQEHQRGRVHAALALAHQHQPGRLRSG